jgi:hypothetical protein
MKLTDGKRCQCARCGEYFNSVTIFDLHRYGRYTFDPATRRCLTGAQMTAKGWGKNPAGFWIQRAWVERRASPEDFGISGDRREDMGEPRVDSAPPETANWAAGG